LKAFFNSLIDRVLRHPAAHWPVAAWALWCGYAGLIFYLSSQALGPELDLLPPNTDKVIHAIEYAVFGVLTYHALGTVNQSWRSWRGRRLHLALAIAIGIAYGASDEFHQSFVPTRDADVWDVVADSAGTTLGAWAVSCIRRAHVLRS
jgi:VanZ family protein